MSYIIYKSKMPRQRDNTIKYAVEVDAPNGTLTRFDGINNLNDIAKKLNVMYFDGFEVVSRPMVSNWLYYPDRCRRSFANRFNITKYNCYDTI